MLMDITKQFKSLHFWTGARDLNLYVYIMEAILTNLYYNPLTGFQGLDKLYKKAKAIDTKITKLKVKDWLKEQETEQITKQEKSTKHN